MSDKTITSKGCASCPFKFDGIMGASYCQAIKHGENEIPVECMDWTAGPRGGGIKFVKDAPAWCPLRSGNIIVKLGKLK